MARLVHDQDSAATNVLRYEKVVARSPGMQERLGQHRRWYAFPKNGTWHFGPSKWAGYEWKDAQDYLDHALDHSGRVTESVLKPWSHEVSHASKLGKRLYGDLARLLANYGKSPSASTSIRIFDNANADLEDAEPQTAKLSELVLEVVNAMPQDQRKVIRNGIRV